MARVRVKICGITRPEDATAAGECGADAIGMILYPSAPRNISLDRARAILAAVPPFVTSVGVFVESSAEEILDTAAQLGLRTVQLNGDQTPDDVAELEGISVIKAIRVTSGTLNEELAKWRKQTPANLAGIVLEPGQTGHAGGSGVANDWNLVREAIAAGAFEKLPPLIAAGGLKPQTVEDVVRTVHPYAVDVSSGVESSLGIKSREKIAAFISASRSAATE